MASKRTEMIEQELAQIRAGYEAGFAGQERATRDLDALDKLIARLRAVQGQLAAIPAGARDDEHSTLAEEAKTRQSAYETERQAIVEAKEAGPELAEFSRLGAFANWVFARYTRHFAGKDRDTRDLGLLSEMIDELGAIRQAMSVILIVDPKSLFQKDADLVTRMAEMYKSELGEITKAYALGTPEEQASRLAVLANAQFDVYRAHFQGHARVTRRPALLQSIIKNLKRIRGAMRELRLSAEAAQNNRANLSIVDNNLRLYETELAEIRKAREATSVPDLMGHLGGAANDVFAEYRQKYSGQDRRKVDLFALSIVCDKLGEIARQMADLGRIERTELNERNLDIVRARLSEFEQEFSAVAQLQPGNR
jgi:hypothetical protein